MLKLGTPEKSVLVGVDVHRAKKEVLLFEKCRLIPIELVEETIGKRRYLAMICIH